MSDWTELMLSELRTRWDAGEKASAIAIALGVSKNAVVGKARRLDLTPRPSPIKRTAAKPDTEVPSPAERAAAIKIPDVSESGVPALPRKVVTREPRPRPVAVEKPAPAPRERTPPEGCRWPLWGFRAAPDHKYCDKPRTDQTEPYCAEHRAVAFTPIKRLVAA